MLFINKTKFAHFLKIVIDTFITKSNLGQDGRGSRGRASWSHYLIGRQKVSQTSRTCTKTNGPGMEDI